MSTRRVCVDTGVVVRLLVHPEDTAVIRLWESWQEAGVTVCAPSLLRYEAANVLHRYGRAGFLAPETVFIAWDAFLSLPVEFGEDAGLHRAALEIARGWDLPAAYDAHYLALAQSRGADLWTTDARLVRVAREKGFRRIHLVGEEN